MLLDENHRFWLLKVAEDTEMEQESSEKLEFWCYGRLRTKLRLHDEKQAG